MIRLIKYLKPYLGMVLLAIILLFAQANFDLALPDYLSRIVNIGIQQGGVESAVPNAIRQSQLDNTLIFMSEGERNAVLDAYTLVDQSSPLYDESIKDYPTLTDEPVYILYKTDSETVNRLNPIIAKGILVVSGIDLMMTNPDMAAEMGLGGEVPFDLSRIPAGMDVFDALANLPTNQLELMTGFINQRFSTMGESSLIQAATRVVKAEYQALGVDTEKLQTNYILKIGAVMLLLTLLSGVCIVAVGYLSARTAAGVARDIRSDVFKKVESFSLSEMNNFSTASLITRTTNDVTQVQMVVMMLVRMVFYAPITGVGGIIRAVGKGGSMWWIIAVAVMALIGIILTLMSIAIPKFKIIQKLIDRINLVARENLAGMLSTGSLTKKNVLIRPIKI